MIIIIDFNFIYFIIGIILTTIIGFLIGKHFFEKQKEWDETATKRIPKEINQEIGEIRGQIPIIGYINNIHQTIILPQKTLQKTPTIIRKEGGLLKKGVISPIPSKRETEINEIKFSVIRREIGKDLSKYTWLDPDFKNALIAVESFLSSDAKIDYDGKSQSESIHIQKMIDLHKQNRLVHLLVPRIRYIDSLEMEINNKWNLVESYYNSLSPEGILVFPAEFEIQKTVDYMKLEKVQHGAKDLIIEARGRHFSKNAVDIVNSFLEQNPDWDVRRIDFSTHKFEYVTEEERSRIKGKLWIELYNWKVLGLKKYDIELNKKAQSAYINSLNNAIINVYQPENLPPSEFRQRLFDTYDEIEQKLGLENFAILKGIGENIGHCLRIATSFRYEHPNLDNICFIDKKKESMVYFIFSKENIENSFLKLGLEKVVSDKL